MGKMVVFGVVGGWEKIDLMGCDSVYKMGG